MYKETIGQLKTAAILLIVLTIITGLLYPLAVTAVAQIFFSEKANGSLIRQDGKAVGSLFIGQSFSSPEYFWGRPSATSPYPYNGAASSGSNSGPSNPIFLKTVKDRILLLKKFPSPNPLIPVDLVTASGSGLDPEISPLAAFYQISRIARVRHIPEKELHQLIENHIQNRSWFFAGEPRVNVLQLNLALNKLRNNYD